VSRTTIQPLRLLFLIFLVLSPVNLPAQRQRQLPPPDESAYGSHFFDQLHNIFGIFRDEDLQRVFQMAKPIRCSDLVVSKGEWRTVAFYNEDRSLGEWCRNNLEEVKADLSVYIFKGSCKGDRGSIQVTTQFPIGSSIDAYTEGRIPLDQVDVNVNAPVSVVFDTRAQTYNFELPYLFLTGRRNSGNIYSLVAPTREDRYAPEVAHRWECKSVRSNDVTYQFLICRTATVARSAAMRNQDQGPGFGASAYFILSDGMEAQTSVSLSFGDAGPPADNPPATASPVPTPARSSPTDGEKEKSVGGWQIPDVRSRILDVRKNEFRIRFSPQAWTGKIGAPEVLSDLKMSSTKSVRLREGADYCLWRPGDASLVDRFLTNEDDRDVLYYLDGFDKNVQSPASLVFDMRTHSGTELGTLKCYFLHSKSAANIDFNHWVSVVGSHLTIEIRQ
jgi:hypothetical protein